SPYCLLFLLSCRPSLLTSSLCFFLFLLVPPPPSSTLFPYTTLFRSLVESMHWHTARTTDSANSWLRELLVEAARRLPEAPVEGSDRKSTRLNSSHVSISYAVFCLKKKNTYTPLHT